MRCKKLVVAMIATAGVVGPAGAASADIVVGYPPNPFSPTEGVLVQQPAPMDVTILFLSPVPPSVEVNAGR